MAIQIILSSRYVFTFFSISHNCAWETWRICGVFFQRVFQRVQVFFRFLMFNNVLLTLLTSDYNICHIRTP